jgi:hypothetical protein
MGRGMYNTSQSDAMPALGYLVGGWGGWVGGGWVGVQYVLGCGRYIGDGRHWEPLAIFPFPVLYSYRYLAEQGVWATEPRYRTRYRPAQRISESRALRYAELHFWNGAAEMAASQAEAQTRREDPWNQWRPPAASQAEDSTRREDPSNQSRPPAASQEDPTRREDAWNQSGPPAASQAEGQTLREDAWSQFRPRAASQAEGPPLREDAWSQ